MSSSPGSGPRILVIRGGALGDFILTLPALRLLRENFPGAWLEILGYKHIVALAEGRFYADATRSIEYGPVAAFFARNATLDPELSEYFAGFQQIVSYLYDPDGIFEANLRRAGAKNILYAFRKLDDSDHAAHQLARPLEQLALYLEDAAARIHPAEEDRAAAAAFLGEAAARPLIALHPGSGSPKKNWPIANWLDLAHRLTAAQPAARLVLIGGEADEAQLAAFLERWAGPPPLLARSLPLPELARDPGAMPPLPRPRHRHLAPRRRGGNTVRPALRADRPGCLATGECAGEHPARGGRRVRRTCRGGST